MATSTTENIYIKMNIDTKAFDNSMTGIKREMATLRGLVGNNLLSAKDQLEVTKRLGTLKNQLDDIKIAANNIDTGDVFGNTARFAGVAANAVAGVTGAMSLLGLESEKAGEVEKKILQFMAIGNALQSVADAKRLGSLAAIYGQKIKEFILGKQILTQEETLVAMKETSTAATGSQIAANAELGQSTISTTGAINAESAALEENNLTLLQSVAATDASTAAKKRKVAMLRELELSLAKTDLMELKNAANQKDSVITAEDLAAAQGEVTAAEEKLVTAKRSSAAATGAATKSERTYTAAKEASSVATTQNTVVETVNFGIKGKMLLLLKSIAQALGFSAAAKALETKAIAAGVPVTLAASTSLKTLTLKVWEFTVALLANPITWFVVALAAVAGGIYLLVRALTAESRAQKAGAEATKEHNKYLKEMSDQALETQRSIDELTDRLLVNAGKLTESDAKRKENGRKFNADMIKLNEDLVKELERINEQYNENREMGTAKRDELLLSAQTAFNKEALRKQKLFTLQQEEVQSDADKAANDKAIEAQKERAAKLQDQREKEFDDLVKEVQDYTNQLLALQDAQYAERNAAEQRNLDYNKNKLKEQLAEKLITQNEYNRQVRQLELDFLIKQRNELKRQYENFIGSEADKIKLKTLLGNKEQDVNNKITDNYVANKDEEAAALVEFNNLFKEVEDEQIKIRLDNIEKAKQAAEAAEAKRRELFNGIFTDWDKLNPEEQIQGIAQAAQFALESYAQISDAVIARNLQSLAAMTEQQLAAVSTQFDQQMQVLDKAVEEGIITQEYYNKQKEEADKKRLEQEKALKTKQAEQEKKYAITQALIGTALAVLNGLQTKPFVPVGLIMAGVAAVAGAVQINTIKSAPLPTFALGGPINGYPHSQGGVPINAEGGEYIINKSVAQKPGMGSFLNKVNSGQISNTTNNNGVDMDIMRQIITEAVTSVGRIPVVNVESDFTRVQKRVSNIETKAKW